MQKYLKNETERKCWASFHDMLLQSQCVCQDWYERFTHCGTWGQWISGLYVPDPGRGYNQNSNFYRLLVGDEDLVRLLYRYFVSPTSARFLNRRLPDVQLSEYLGSGSKARLNMTNTIQQGFEATRAHFFSSQTTISPSNNNSSTLCSQIAPSSRSASACPISPSQAIPPSSSNKHSTFSSSSSSSSSSTSTLQLKVSKRSLRKEDLPTTGDNRPREEFQALDTPVKFSKIVECRPKEDRIVEYKTIKAIKYEDLPKSWSSTISDYIGNFWNQTINEPDPQKRCIYLVLIGTAVVATTALTVWGCYKVYGALFGSTSVEQSTQLQRDMQQHVEQLVRENRPDIGPTVLPTSVPDYYTVQYTWMYACLILIILLALVFIPVWFAIFKKFKDDRGYRS